MQDLSTEGQRIVEEAASRHGVSTGAALHLLLAIAAGGGNQAQFNHPELGGMGQWSRGGMIMVGDMFNQGLKYRVDALCNDLATALRGAAAFAPAPVPSSAATSSQSQWQGGGDAASGAPLVSLFVPGAFASRWPEELGAPASTGSQNDLHYALFPEKRRLAIERGGRITIYDTGDHAISGFAQAQSGDQSLSFTSQRGLVRLAELRLVSPQAGGAGPVQDAPVPAPPRPSDGSPAQGGAGGAAGDDIFALIERLAELRKKEILTEDEFAAKKAELLARL